MHLNRIVLPVVDVEEAARFYSSTLSVPVRLEAGAASITIGSSQLDLRPAQGPAGPHHVAITIPRNTFASARSWLAGRAQVLDRDGQSEFEGPPSWNSRSLYFDGPEGAVLELIERRDLPPARTSGFSSDELVCVSEVGIAVPDVAQAAALLKESAGIETYGEPASHDFAAVGDVHGLLILVRPGRAWLPTTDRYSVVTPTTVEAVGSRGATCTLGGETAIHLRGSDADHR